MSNNKYSIIISRTYFRSCHRFFNTNHTICFPSTNTSKKSLQSPKTIHNTMKQTKNLKWKLSESQLDVGCLIDPKIYFKHKPVNEVERWALGSAYQTVHYNVNNCISNAASIGNQRYLIAFSKITTEQFFCGIKRRFPTVTFSKCEIECA